MRRNNSTNHQVVVAWNRPFKKGNQKTVDIYVVMIKLQMALATRKKNKPVGEIVDTTVTG